MTRRAARLIIAIAVLGACGIPSQRHPTELDANGVQVVVPGSSTSLPPGTPTRHADLCLVSDAHLVTIVTELPSPLSAGRAIQALVDAPRTGLPAGTRSAINDPDLVTAGATTRGVARIELNAAFTQMSPADQILALAQIVCTLTSLPGTGQVWFTHAGLPIDIPRADSSLTNQPVSRFDYRRLLPSS